MGFFAQAGKPLFNGSALLVPGTLAANLFVPLASNWTDVYSIVISTNDTAVQQVTLSDGTTSLSYFVGGGANNPVIIDQGATPVRFKMGATIAVTAGAITTGKTIAVNIRGLVSRT